MNILYDLPVKLYVHSFNDSTQEGIATTKPYEDSMDGGQSYVQLGVVLDILKELKQYDEQKVKEIAELLYGY